MDELARALEEVGLQHYRCVPVDNDADFGTLLQLTESDLRELGISLGHGRVPLKTIQTAVRKGALMWELPAWIDLVELLRSQQNTAKKEQGALADCVRRRPEGVGRDVDRAKALLGGADLSAA